MVEQNKNSTKFCDYRIEKIGNKFELYKQCKRMEKLIDELARSRTMEKTFRQEKK